MKWYVIYTKPNSEIKVAKRIIDFGINAYCPVYVQVRQYSDRRKKVYRPLLSSYVLVQLSEIDRPKIFSVPGVVRYLFWLGKPAEVRDEEIQILKRNLAGIHDDINLSELTKGKEYVVNSGPFRGQKGTILNILKNKLRLQLPDLGVLLTLNRART